MCQVEYVVKDRPLFVVWRPLAILLAPFGVLWRPLVSFGVFGVMLATLGGQGVLFGVHWWPKVVKKVQKSEIGLSLLSYCHFDLMKAVAVIRRCC